MLSYNLQSKFHLYLSLAKGHNNIRTEGILKKKHQDGGANKAGRSEDSGHTQTAKTHGTKQAAMGRHVQMEQSSVLKWACRSQKQAYLVDGEDLAVALLNLLELPQEVPAHG